MTSKKNGTTNRNYHKCSKEEVIDRMSLILVGNGHPEEGLAFRFNEFMLDHKRVVDTMAEIKSNINKAIESAGTAARAIELYKAEEIVKDTTKNDIEKKQLIADELKARIKKELEDRELLIANLKAKRVNDHWQRIIWIIMAVIAVCSIWVAIYLNNKSIIKQVEQKEGVSKTTRGGYVKYIDQGFIDSVKVKQVTKDTIK